MGQQPKSTGEKKYRSEDLVSLLTQDDDTISLMDLLDNLLHYHWHFIIVTVLAVALATGYAIIATPIYTANSLIQVAENKGTSMIGALDQVNNSPLFAQSSPIASEIEIIRSRAVIGEAIERSKANVNVSIMNQTFTIRGWLTRILDIDESGLAVPLTDISDSASVGKRLEIAHIRVPAMLYGQPMRLTIEEDRQWTLVIAETDKLILQGKGSGERFTAYDGQLQFELAPFVARPGTEFKITVYSLQSEISRTLASLSVSEAKRQTNLISMSYQSPNPVVAAQLLNTIADVYLRQNIARRSDEADRTLQFLKGELSSLRMALDESEQAFNTFRSQTRSVDMTFELQELLRLSTALETQTHQLELKRKELAFRYDADHPAMQNLEGQMQALRQQQQAISDRVAELPNIQQDYIRLARDVEVNNLLYVSLLNNAQQLEIAKAGIVGNVTIIDRAVVPESPTKPNKKRIVVIGALAGLLLGFLLTQVIGMMAKVVRDPKRLELNTGIPTLSVMPLDGQQLSRVESGGLCVFMFAKDNPNGATTEAMRRLRTALLFVLSEKPRSKVVLITSAVPSQGKGFISANLSYLMGATGKRVILLDADIRKSSLHRYFDFDSEGKGLSSLLRNECTLNDAIIKSAYDNLDFLPSGHLGNPGDLLAGEHIQNIITNLASTYDFVIIDSPPLLPVHDACALGRAADVSLFVARQDAVSLPEVQNAIDVFNKSGNRFDGMIYGFVPSRIRYPYNNKSKYAKYGDYHDAGDNPERM